MIAKFDFDDYRFEADEPYLTKDIMGKYVILQDEMIMGAGASIFYTSEILVNPDPSEAEIFRMKLKGRFRRNTFATGHHSKGS